ncbi:MAG: glutaredoxin family protein [Oceanospirillaceae bacterium]|nr:glutaredoxin family protein [Oceanospirillaceae bacterium]
MKAYILYSTEHCHLCEIAQALIVNELDGSIHQVEVEDIADDDLLLARYGIRIPVLVDVQSKGELQWPFDALSLKKFVGL